MVPVVVMLTEFHIIQGLLAFISFYSSFGAQYKNNKQMSCTLWCCATATAVAAVYVFVKLFSNDMNEIYVTDELGCGHTAEQYKENKI